MWQAPNQKGLAADTPPQDAKTDTPKPESSEERRLSPKVRNIEPRKGLPAWGPDYIAAMTQCGGHKILAAKSIDMTYWGVYQAMVKYPDLAAAVAQIKAYYDSEHLEKIESLLYTQSLKPGCVTERIFVAKALDRDKYGDKQRGGNMSFNISFGFPTPSDSGQLPASATIITDADMGEGGGV